jgi:prolipoprotein diacylglyceryltransferase
LNVLHLLHPTAYSLLMLAGIAAGYLCTRVRCTRFGIDGEVIDVLVPLSAIAGLAGAAALGPFVGGGRTILGGLIAGTLAAAAYGKWRGVNLGRLGDAAAPGLMIGEALGRAGCFTAGCCGGVHGLPVQLIEGAGCLVIASAVAAMPAPRIGGERFLAMGIGYATLRIVLEHWRIDAVAAGPLTEGQWAAAAIAAACAITWAVRRKMFGKAEPLAAA